MITVRILRVYLDRWLADVEILRDGIVVIGPVAVPYPKTHRYEADMSAFMTRCREMLQAHEQAP